MTSSSARKVTKFDSISNKSMTTEGDGEGKTAVDNLKFIKSPLREPNSNASNNNRPKVKPREGRSMIPQSRLRRSSKGESVKPKPKPDEPVPVQKPKKVEEQTSAKAEQDSTPSENSTDLIEVTDTDVTFVSLKPRKDSGIQLDVSLASFKDARETCSEAVVNEEDLNKTSEMRNDVDSLEEEREAERQEILIKNLYESIKVSKEPLFGELETPEDKEQQSLDGKPSEEQTIQEQYDVTLGDILAIWKDTISVMNSVKEHTLKFVEEESKSIDKEQLSLEAEMLQLAVDFAINYSNLKTDFLLKRVRKRLQVKELEKSELESFMDSKTFAGLYNDEDLAAMAQTVKELNTSILKGEDLDVD